MQAAVAAVYRDAGRPLCRSRCRRRKYLQRAAVPRDRLQGRRHQGDGAAAESFSKVASASPPDRRSTPVELETDLDWANRNPFRQVEAVFGPGKDLGLTDVNIQVMDRKPWQVYAGYANSGTLPDRPQSLLCRGQRGAFRRCPRVLSAHRQWQFLDGRRTVQPARRREICQSGGAVAHAARLAHQSRSRRRSCADQ